MNGVLAPWDVGPFHVACFSSAIRAEEFKADKSNEPIRLRFYY